MTLLIGTVARSGKPHIVITADGRCTGFDGVSRSVLSESYQKLFPIPTIAAAVAHHGENILAGAPVKEVLDSFINVTDDLSLATVERLADALLDHTGQRVIDTLRMIPRSKQIGFWVAGFGHGRSQPELHEMCWTKSAATGEITLERNVHGNLVFGGDAQRFVKHYCTQPVDGMYGWDRLPHQTVGYAVKFHAKLYALAESAQANEADKLFGGHKHQLQISREGWKWIIPPFEHDRPPLNA